MAIVPFRLVTGNGHRPSAESARQPLDTDALVGRLLDMAEWTRLKGSQDHANRLLLAAWSVYDDRRACPRVPVFRRGSVQICYRILKVICIDLSLSGALIKCQLPLPENGMITLKLRGLFALPAVIIAGGLLARVRFERLSAAQERALGSFLGTRMHSPRFIQQFLSSENVAAVAVCPRQPAS